MIKIFIASICSAILVFYLDGAWIVWLSLLLMVPNFLKTLLDHKNKDSVIRRYMQAEKEKFDYIKKHDKIIVKGDFRAYETLRETTFGEWGKKYL